MSRAAAIRGGWNTRDLILEALDTFSALHTAEVAEEVGVSHSAARRHLDRLEAEGVVEGINGDELGLSADGRKRTFWFLVPEGCS